MAKGLKQINATSANNVYEAKIVAEPDSGYGDK